MIIDGHVHTPYCPHGTKDTLKSYIENALERNYRSITFTEHAPLPPSFTDPVPDQDSGMKATFVEPYIRDILQLKKEYQQDIDILAGFELDYIEGYEGETKNFLDTYGDHLDDSILSVHFVKGNEGFYCIDYNAETFENAIDDFGTISSLYDAYFRTIKQSVEFDLGKYKPKRIGHMTLVRKFHKQFPSPDGWVKPIPDLLQSIRNKKYQLDYNGAGFIKPLCGESYPPHSIAKEAYDLGIPLIYGSDSHSSKSIGQGYDGLDHTLIKC
jgi:histidinol-phosphatase (PHP family)